MVASWTSTLNDTGSNLLECIKFVNDIFTILKAPGSNPPYSKQRIMVNIEARLPHPYTDNWRIRTRSLRSGSIQNGKNTYEKNLSISRWFKPAPFRVNVFNATPELPERVQTDYNTAFKSKHMLQFYWPGQPLSIRLLLNLSGPPFSPKKQQRLFALASVSILLLWFTFCCSIAT